MKYNSAFCSAVAAGKKGAFDSLLNMKYFIHAEKFRWPTQKLLPTPLIFRQSHVSPRGPYAPLW
jgi:hypothetical protein